MKERRDRSHLAGIVVGYIALLVGVMAIVAITAGPGSFPVANNDPATAGASPREKAIVQTSIDLTLAPGQVEPAQLRALREVGLSDDEILDLIHSIAIFAWANRLMLNLGEPVG